MPAEPARPRVLGRADAERLIAGLNATMGELELVLEAEAVEDHHNHLEVEEEQAEETHQAATHQEVEEEEAVEEIPQEEQEEQEEPNHKHNLQPHHREKPNSMNQGCSMESQKKLTIGWENCKSCS